MRRCFNLFPAKPCGHGGLNAVQQIAFKLIKIDNDGLLGRGWGDARDNTVRTPFHHQVFHQLNQRNGAWNVIGLDAGTPALGCFARREKRAMKRCGLAAVKQPAIVIQAPNTFPFANRLNEALVTRGILCVGLCDWTDPLGLYAVQADWRSLNRLR